MDYLKCHRNFKKKLEKELDKMIAGEKKSLDVKNIPSDKFCDATGCGDISSIKDISSAFAVVPGMERLA